MRRRQVEARCFSRFEFIYSFASLIIISMNLVNFTKLSYFITIIQPNNKNKALYSKRIEKKTSRSYVLYTRYNYYKYFIYQL